MNSQITVSLESGRDTNSPILLSAYRGIQLDVSDLRGASCSAICFVKNRRVSFQYRPSRFEVLKASGHWLSHVQDTLERRVNLEPLHLLAVGASTFRIFCALLSFTPRRRPAYKQVDTTSARLGSCHLYRLQHSHPRNGESNQKRGV